MNDKAPRRALVGTAGGESGGAPPDAARRSRYVVQRWGFGFVVAERGKRRIATFEKRSPAEKYRDALNAGSVTA